MTIMSYFPEGLTPRPAQTDLLLKLERAWLEHDVFVLTAPTGAGKSAIINTIARWLEAARRSVSICMPSNVLVDQYDRNYPTVTLHRKDYYGGHELHQEAVQAARDAPIRLMNNHIFYRHRMHASAVIFDEAHTLTDMLNEELTVNLWWSEYKFPLDMPSMLDLVIWAEEYIDKNSRSSPLTDKLLKAREDILKINQAAIPVWRGLDLARADLRMQIVPVISQVAGKYLVPKDRVHKVVLLSATISAQDVREMGLEHRRICYLGCDSPIPVDQRPVVFDPQINMAARCRPYAMAKFATLLTDVLSRIPDKGLVHLPYAVAAMLREHVSDPRLLFHTKDNKQQVLGQFRRSAPEEGLVLVASGLYEGIDLPYDEARWQVIGVVPFPNLGDPRVAAKTADERDWFDWETIKKLVQAYGRIVRGPDDSGITFIWDNQLSVLLHRDRDRKQRLIPAYFSEAIIKQ